MTNTDSSRVTRTKTTLTYLARKTVLTTGSTLPHGHKLERWGELFMWVPQYGHGF